MSMFDVYPTELIEKVAEKLKDVKEIQVPSWAPFVKTGTSKETDDVKTIAVREL